MNKTVALVLSFLIPYSFRLALELYSFPFTIGFDTMAYYLPFLTGYTKWSPLQLYATPPLYYMIIYSLNSIIVNPIMTLKIVAIVLQGFLGLSLYLWATTFFKDGLESLLFSITASFYFTVLRISWDLHRNVLGLGLMMITLWLVNKSGKYATLLSSFTAFLTALSHQIEPVILGVILLYKYFRGLKMAIIPALATLVTWMSIIHVSSVLKNVSIPEYLVMAITQSGEQVPPFPQGLEMLGFIVYIFLPLLPFTIIGMLHNWRLNPDLNIWIILCFTLSFIARFGFRFALLLSIPLMIYASMNVKKLQIVLLIITIVFSTGYTIMHPENPFPYFSSPLISSNGFLYTMPTSMLQNTIPLDWSYDALNVSRHFLKCSCNNASIIVTSRVFLGYLLLAGVPNDKIVVYGEAFGDPCPIIDKLARQGYEVYLIDFTPNSTWYNTFNITMFNTVVFRGEIALFKYEGVIS